MRRFDNSVGGRRRPSGADGRHRLDLADDIGPQPGNGPRQHGDAQHAAYDPGFGHSRSHQVDRDIDIATDSLGIRASLVCGVDEGLRVFSGGTSGASYAGG